MSRRRKGVLIIVGIVLFLLAALFFTVTDGLREAVAVEAKGFYQNPSQPQVIIIMTNIDELDIVITVR